MHASHHQHIKENLILRRCHQQKQQYDIIRFELSTSKCGGSWNNSQFTLQYSSDGEETVTIPKQINHEIENGEDHDETDDHIADDAEETSVFEIPISTEDDVNKTPGPSTRMK
ncbi:hypothetical protein EVAR_37840_1 [Eumeta japonica]|uniref:Uncharacterized protein n=1 Tax=Eumeta variegata TaxID=151549 RepID=A0A4C1X0H2_EUMVA|nr:hypothetical protein EVAR_37840_1 [Eumeta japonica]